MAPAQDHDQEFVRFVFEDRDEEGEPTGDKIEVELTRDQAQPLKAVSYFVKDDAPLLSNADGTVTRLDSAVPDPTEGRNG